MDLTADMLTADCYWAEVIRATEEEKEAQISNLRHLQEANRVKGQDALQDLQKRALHNQNVFEALMDATKFCSLGQITHALYEVGGQYRRNM